MFFYSEKEKSIGTFLVDEIGMYLFIPFNEKKWDFSTYNTMYKEYTRYLTKEKIERYYGKLIYYDIELI